MLPTRWSHLIRRGLLGGSLLTIASPALAEPCEDSVEVVAGIELADKPRLVGGIGLRKCITNAEDGFMRVEFGSDTPRLVVGMRTRPFEKMESDHAGELAGIEAGLGAGTDRLGLHLAGTFGDSAAFLAAQTTLPLIGKRAMYGSLLGGVAPFPVVDDEPEDVEGRPLVVDGRLVKAAVMAAPHLRATDDRAVHAHFARSARYEAASVWTFLRLASELLAAGAPRELVYRALDAADDEVRHAILCSQAAFDIELAMLPDHVARPRFTERTPHAIAILAEEAWLDGCLNEGAAAEQARLAAADAHGSIAHALAAIAHDERRHAELSWAILGWLFSVEPDLARSALARATRRTRSPAPVVATDDGRERALAIRGVPTRRVVAAAHADAYAAALARRSADFAA